MRGGGWNGIEHLASKSGNGGQGRGQASCYVYDRQQRQLGGPVELNPQAHYELHLIRPERAEHHFYRQPFLRSSSLVRLNTSPEGSAIEQNTHVGPNHATLIITRDMEW